MSKIRFFAPNECIVSELVRHLSADRDQSDSLVILPTLRLATYVQRELALNGAFAPPRLINFQSWIQELASPYLSEGLKTQSSIQKKWRIESLLNDFENLGLSHAHELGQIIREFDSFGINTAQLQVQIDDIADQFFKEQKEDFQLLRLAETVKFLDRYYDQVKRDDLHSPESMQRLQAQIILENKDKLKVSESNVMVVGLTTLNESERSILPELLKQFDAEAWLSDFRDPRYENAPLHELGKTLGGKPETLSPSTPRIYTAACNRISSQWEFISIQIEKLLHNGTRSSDIAILFADESRGHEARRKLLSERGIQHNCAVGLSFFRTSFGSFVSAFMSFLEHGDLRSLAGLVQHPYFDDWRETNRDELVRWIVELPKNISISLLKDDIIKPWSALLQGQGQLGTNEWFEYLFKQMEMFFEKSEEQREKQAVELFKENILQMKELPLSDRIRFCREVFDSLEVRDIGEPLSGVQVLSLDEARSYPFQYVFLMDFNDGVFPKKPPRDVIIPDFLKRKLGLYGWNKLAAMEAVTFQSLAARIECLCACYIDDETQGLVASSILDAVETTPLPSPANKQRAMQTWEKQVAEDILGSAPKDWHSLLPQSTSSLDSFLKCPYRVLIKNVTRKSWPPQSVDKRSEGEWLHSVVEHFFMDWPFEKDFANSSDFQSFATERLVLLSQTLRDGFDPSVSLLMHLEHFSWPMLAKHFADLFQEANFHPSPNRKSEYQFKSHLDWAGIELKSRGQIDAIEEFSTYWLVVDYKRKAVPKKKSIDLGLSTQLPFYLQAMAKDRSFSQKPLLAGYWSILDGTWTSVVQSQPLSGPLPSGRPLEGLSQTISDLFLARLEQVKNSQQFAPDPSDCGFCEYSQICRKDDLQYSVHFQDSYWLEENYL